MSENQWREVSSIEVDYKKYIDDKVASAFLRIQQTINDFNANIAAMEARVDSKIGVLEAKIEALRKAHSDDFDYLESNDNNVNEAINDINTNIIEIERKIEQMEIKLSHV